MNSTEFGLTKVLRQCLSLLSINDRRKIFIVAVAQILLSALDLIGVAVIGVIGAVAVNGIASKNVGNSASSFLEFLGLDGASSQKQVLTLAAIALLSLIGKTLITLLMTKRIIYFLSRVAARMSSQLIGKLLNSSILTVQSQNTQGHLFAVTGGISTITVGVLGILISLISDFALMLVLTIGLFVVEPIIAILNLILFALVALSLHRLMHVRALVLGDRQSRYGIRSNQRIFEVLTSYRETFVKNRRSYYADVIGTDRMQLAETSAELSFMPQISKYVIESTILVAAVIVCGVQFVISDPTRAVAVLAVFMAASLRIAPAVLRVQQSFVSLRSNYGAAKPTLNLIQSLGNEKLDLSYAKIPPVDYIGFSPNVNLTDVSFVYPNAKNKTIEHISFSISEGEVVAIVGPSGAGKTTLVDLILGILEPNSGQIKINGVHPKSAILNWSGAIAYVPQDVFIFDGTIKENICMGFESENVSDNVIYECLQKAQLFDFVSKLPLGIQSEVGERGTRLSGGQRQRLGIARALLTNPRLLVLDEATSALDGETEANLSADILAMKGKTTVILIAHRLSTVRNADKVIYIENGSKIAQGTFFEVRNIVPEFDKQAKLMGMS